MKPYVDLISMAVAQNSARVIRLYVTGGFTGLLFGGALLILGSRIAGTGWPGRGRGYTVSRSSGIPG